MSFQDLYGAQYGNPDGTGMFGTGFFPKALGAIASGIGSGASSLYNRFANAPSIPVPGATPAAAAPSPAPAPVPAPAAPAAPSPMAQAFQGGGVPMPQPRPQAASAPNAWGALPPGAPMPINADGADFNMRNGAASGPANFGTTPGQYSPAGNWQAQTNPGLIGRFVNAMRGASPQQGQTQPQPMMQQQQPSMGLLPKLWNDISGISKAFGAGAGSGAGVSPFNTTGSLY